MQVTVQKCVSVGICYRAVLCYQEMLKVKNNDIMTLIPTTTQWLSGVRQGSCTKCQDIGTDMNTRVAEHRLSLSVMEKWKG